ncbi:MAG TPA: translocation/assembly module TamB domain-containing protein, partial [Myxococcaceae bacterium]|nr:translocation/assembly module TamB domain-containing protein [Myxococcaceae bacterium]
MDLQLLGKHEPPLPGEDPAPLLSGITRGRINARGTLADPTVELDGAIEGLGTAQSASVGDISMRYRYRSALSVLEADLTSRGEGRMTVRGRAPLDLSWKGTRKPVVWQRVPIEANVEAVAFNPAFLSGALPKLQRIGGSVEAKVNVRGTAAVPDVQGRFEWKNGVLAIAGSGSYEGIHLAVHGTEERIVLEELTARAGEGSARIAGEATREGPEQHRLAITAQMKEFPLIVEDQLAATLSVSGNGKGTASLAATDLAVAIYEAHVELPPTPRKELQELEKPDDVVFLRNGKPVEKTKTGMGGSGSAGQASAPEIRVRLSGARNLWVEGDDLDVELGLDDDFRVIKAAEPEI